MAKNNTIRAVRVKQSRKLRAGKINNEPKLSVKLGKADLVYYSLQVHQYTRLLSNPHIVIWYIVIIKMLIIDALKHLIKFWERL